MQSNLLGTLCLGILAGLLATAEHGILLSLARNEPSGGGMPIEAPDLRSADAWLNTEKPITLADLRGQVVLLDFWTYCCINCMHVFPDLKYLENKFRDEPFVVVGVHSGKFDQEKDPENIRNAVLRHNIEHPVAVDSDYEIWKAYGVQAWPTLIVIDPEGRIVGQISGEGHRELLEKIVDQHLDVHRTKRTLGKAMTFRRERESFRSEMLEFPGKVLADSSRGRLFISDTNHDRVLMTNLEGKILKKIGTGRVGLNDGGFATARFHQPQGLALDAEGKTLYVADTENHALRAVDLVGETVSTLAGTGKQGNDFNANGPGRSTELSSPWDLVRVGERLFIAMAGSHQIWTYDLLNRRVAVFAGTGQESRVDGANRSAAFGQPSGLATDGHRLFVADSEISTIRMVEIGVEGRTGTLAGSGGLFEFGRKDGIGTEARFQHPLGVALAGDDLFVADTFNHVIRRVELGGGRVTTFLGSGRDDPESDSAISFNEPGGLSVGGDHLYIADTNQHRIVVADIRTGTVKILKISGP